MSDIILLYPVEKFPVTGGAKIIRSRIHKSMQIWGLNAINIGFI